VIETVAFPPAVERCVPPLLHDAAPAFSARTTMGDRKLSDYAGRWLVLFSHPADFTPVCTSEFIAFAAALPEFAAIGCDLLGLSVDSLFSHLAWIRNIRERFGVSIGFPIVEDPSMAIARAYGMISPHSPDSSLVRASFVIDPSGIIRAITWYPMTTGRNVGEQLRLVAALQATDAHGVLTPEAWHPGDDVIVPPPLTVGPAGDSGGPGELDWYYRTVAGPSAGGAAG
jgi:peroxiredoxin (alkyl hydroperoxide reductase subunit C)